MKKVLGVMMVMMMVIGLMIPAFASAGVYGGTDMWVNCENGKRLNLRMEPSTKAKLITRFDCGTRVEVMEDLGNGWVRVATDEFSGYVMKKFLVEKKPGKYEITEREDNFKAVTAYTVTAKARGTKTDESVCVRVKPNKTAKSIRRLTAGDTLQVIEVGKTWSKVIDSLTGKTGFVANDYIERI